MLGKRFLRYVLITSVWMIFCATANVNALPATEDEEITVDKTIHDFGTIKESKGNVSAVFTIKNMANVPIILSKVRASCGCTTPEWTKEPIAPGKTGKVTATYNPKGAGPFEKSITINISVGDKTRTIVVKVKGTVVAE